MSDSKYFEAGIKINLVSLGARLRIHDMNKLIAELNAPINESKFNKMLQFLNLSKTIQKKKSLANMNNHQRFVRNMHIYGQSLYIKGLKEYSSSLKESMNKTYKSAKRIKRYKVNAFLKSKSIDNLRLCLKKPKNESMPKHESSTYLPSVLTNQRENWKTVISNAYKRGKSPSSVMITTGKGFLHKNIKMDETNYNINELIRYNPYLNLKKVLV